MLKTKVLIVGAGPAGTSCAIRLRQLKQKCILIDNQVFPRNKLCGGAWTQKTSRVFKELLGRDDYDNFCQESCTNIGNRVNLFWETEKFADFNSINNYKLFDRYRMDNWLFQHYKHIGGEAYDGDGIYSIDFDRRIAKLSSGREIEYDFLVAADGANSRVKQLLAKSKSNFKAYLPNGITFEVLVDRNDLSNVEGINLHFNITKEAYSWVFGKGDKICIGLGQYLSNSSDGRIVLKDFMKKLGVKNIDKYPIRGAMLPYNLFDQKPIWNQQVLLVGDSACLVEPFTGEGIFYAAQSGIFAAESIFTCTHCDKCNIEKLYLSKLKPIYRILKDGIYYFKLFNNDWISKSFRRKANNRKDFLAYFYDIRIDNGMCLPFWLIALRYKIGKFFNRLKKKLKKS